jgi:Tol biopolymer transport system component
MMSFRRGTLFLGCLAVLTAFCGGRAWSADPTYWQDVRPILRKNCVACHNVRQVKEPEISGGLTLDSFDAAARNPKLFQPGKSTESLLIKLCTTTDTEKRMPLGATPLPEESIALLRRWIDTGAKEGTKPDSTETPVTTNQPKLRKLDVVLPTTATPPAGLLGNAKPAPLQVSLKVGPLSPVTAVTFSPDGKRLATGCYGLVTVWDLGTAKPEKVLTSVLGAVNDLRFSPDGTLLAVAGGQPSAKGDLRLFGTADWKLAATLTGHDDVVFGVAFSPDAKKLASASFDKTVRVWDVATHKTDQTLTGHSDFVYAVAFSPDGKKLASASKDRTVKLVDLATGNSLFTFGDRDQDVMAVAFSPDGKSVVSSGLEPGLSWHDAVKGGRIRNQGGHGVAVHELGFSKDGQTLLSAGGDRTVRTWNAATGAAGKTFAVGSSAFAAGMSPDGKLIAAGSFDGLVRLFDVTSGRHLLTLLSLPPAKEESSWLALTPEGYAAASVDVTSVGEWRMGGQAVAAAPVWKALTNADATGKAVRAETLPPPTFGK